MAADAAAVKQNSNANCCPNLSLSSVFSCMNGSAHLDRAGGQAAVQAAEPLGGGGARDLLEVPDRVALALQGAWKCRPERLRLSALAALQARARTALTQHHGQSARRPKTQLSAQQGGIAHKPLLQGRQHSSKGGSAK